MTGISHIAGHTWHGRKGAVENAFRYSIDYVLLDADRPVAGPRLFSRNRRNVCAVYDRDHGGAPKQGRGVAWVRDVLAAHDLAHGRGGDHACDGAVQLLTQPRMFGYVFNPVSFWLCHDRAGALRVVIAEVGNTFGQRHSYLCHRDDLAPLTHEDHLTARKVFHVSPFQPVAGTYMFRFDIRDDRIGIWIDLSHGNGDGGVTATLTGRRVPLSSAGILRACVLRPFGARRVLALIYWQALKLKLKRALYRPAPPAPDHDISR